MVFFYFNAEVLHRDRVHNRVRFEGSSMGSVRIYIQSYAVHLSRRAGGGVAGWRRSTTRWWWTSGVAMMTGGLQSTHQINGSHGRLLKKYI